MIQRWDKLPGEKHLRIVPNAEHSFVCCILDATQVSVEITQPWIDRQSVSQTVRQTDNRQTDRQTDRQTGKQRSFLLFLSF
jgi:PhoPQ-activated pathogenicity-related protein